ncbi:MAG TPA: Hsp20/alpha crystallin family protein [Chloroflexota bacterium]|nr:Hsp20/alpha crystallin family protein [Chloroflexota bacterium]
MNRQEPGREMFRQAALQYLFGREPGGTVRTESGSAQLVPVNVYETEHDIAIVAPMPGVEADDIDIEVVARTVTLRAGMRGPHQQDRRYLVHQWSYGPYYCSVQLGVDIDARQANASHGNGVLVVTLPKAQASKAVRVALKQSDSQHAMHRGHSGQGGEAGNL